MDEDCEDYFEECLVAEAGFELEARIFGAVPEYENIDNLYSSVWVFLAESALGRRDLRHARTLP